MKNILKVCAAVSLTTAFIACDNQNDTTVVPNSELHSSARLAIATDAIREEAARTLAKSLGNAQLRTYLKAEALKKFDGDYDVLFSKVLTYVTTNSLSGVTLNESGLVSDVVGLPLLSNVTELD